MGNRVKALTESGVALWLDGVSRADLGGGLATLVADRGVTGVAIEPVTLHEALANAAYDDQLRSLAAVGATVEGAVTALLADDAASAAEVLRPVYDRTGGQDGYVTVTLPPWATGSTSDTVAASRAFAESVGRPNLLMGVPATSDGLAAVTELVAAGTGVNVTPAFSPAQYRAAVDAYLTGLEKAAADGRAAAAGPAAVSVVVNQVDTDVDKLLWRVGTDQSASLRGTAAVANARLVHAVHAEGHASERWAGLAAQGLRPPRLAWTSMAVRDPYYADTHYVDALAAGGVTATLSEATLAAIGDVDSASGSELAPVDSAAEWPAAAEATVAALAAVGVSLADVTGTLERTGLPRQAHAWRSLRGVVEDRLAADH